MSTDDFRRLIKDLGLDQKILKPNDIAELIEVAKKEEEGIVMVFETMAALAIKLF